MLLARLFESLPLTCPNCGADMRVVASITERPPQSSGFSPTSASRASHHRLRPHAGRRRGTTVARTPYPTGTPWPSPSACPSTCSTSKCRGSPARRSSAGGRQGSARPLLATPRSRPVTVPSIDGATAFSPPHRPATTQHLHKRPCLHAPTMLATRPIHPSCPSCSWISCPSVRSRRGTNAIMYAHTLSRTGPATRQPVRACPITLR